MRDLLASLPIPFLHLLKGRRLPADLLTTQLERASNSDLCPICYMDAEARYIWLWSLMWESVTDPDSRNEFIKAGGLCRADSWAMVEVALVQIKSSLGVAILFEHMARLIERAIIRSGASTEPWIHAPRLHFDLGRGCQACSTGNAAVHRSIDRLALATLVPNTPWLERAFPICHDHMRLLLQKTSSARARETFASLQLTSLRGLSSTSPPPPSKLKKSPPRLDAALFSRGDRFPVPHGSLNLHRTAVERCPVCESLALGERELMEDESWSDESFQPDLPCLGHHLELGAGDRKLSDSLRSTGLEVQSQHLQAPHSSAPVPHCPICRRIASLEDEIVQTKASQWAKAVNGDDLICLRHLESVARNGALNDREELLEVQGARLAYLIRELQGFIALHDYRSRQRPPEGPDSPYRWALRFFTSEPVGMAQLLSVGVAEQFLPSRRSPR